MTQRNVTMDEKTQAKIGILGVTGRMGTAIRNILDQDTPEPGLWAYAGGWARTTGCLETVWAASDVVVDVTVGAAFPVIAKQAARTPKPWVICSTGWSMQDYQQTLNAVAQHIPIVIAPNTSVGAALQRWIAGWVMRRLRHDRKDFPMNRGISQATLGASFDVDIWECHHRHKKDVPSGTANALIQSLQTADPHLFLWDPDETPGPRPAGSLAVQTQRSGGHLATHTVQWSSMEEVLSVHHAALDRSVFAKGALHIAQWIMTARPAPGLYGLEDVLGLPAF